MLQCPRLQATHTALSRDKPRAERRLGWMSLSACSCERAGQPVRQKDEQAGRRENELARTRLSLPSEKCIPWIMHAGFPPACSASQSISKACTARTTDATKMKRHHEHQPDWTYVSVQVFALGICLGNATASLTKSLHKASLLACSQTMPNQPARHKSTPMRHPSQRLHLPTPSPPYLFLSSIFAPEHAPLLHYIRHSSVPALLGRRRGLGFGQAKTNG
ncbi:uncharacterized protein IWZ02DRAFT_37710 [Phyllosticta citriasiana]|uniref:Uncharacterized protein n=1 Tax=Phyllosticta citriasiana TaxID=595635 RepID=A0ABR1KEZ2_9PEZI